MTNTDRGFWALLSGALLAAMLTYALAPADAPPMALVPVSAPVNPAAAEALLDAGYQGDPEDGCDPCVYVPVGTKVDFPGGSAEVTPTGLAVCEDWITVAWVCR